MSSRYEDIDWSTVEIQWSEGVGPPPLPLEYEPCPFSSLAGAFVSMSMSVEEFERGLQVLRSSLGRLTGAPDECTPDTSQPYPF